MKTPNIVIPASLALCLCCSAQAQIYESTDSEGNKVFTDRPSEGAEVVELPDANIADAVKPAPPSSPEGEPAQAPSKPATGSADDRIHIIGDDHSDELEARIAREKRREVRDAEPRHEVRDAESREEVRDAEPRHEVRDAENREAAAGAVPQGAPHIVNPKR